MTINIYKYMYIYIYIMNLLKCNKCTNIVCNVKKRESITKDTIYTFHPH